MNTCFTPTPYRDPHIGHAWIAWNNYDIARRSGGRFNLIFDDIAYTTQHLDTQGYSLDHSIDRWQEQLEWLGCVPDAVWLSSDNADAHAAAWEALGLAPLEVTPVHSHIDTVILGGPWPPGDVVDCYNPAFVAKWCVDDHIAGVDAFVNGMQFLGERQLYDFFCRQLGFRAIAQMHLPHIRRETSDRKESKSDGAPGLCDLREAGYTPLQIISTLLECARVSEAKGLRETIIPAGYLETEEVRWLTFRPTWANAPKDLDGFDFSADVRAAVKRNLTDWKALVAGKDDGNGRT